MLDGWFGLQNGNLSIVIGYLADIGSYRQKTVDRNPFASSYTKVYVCLQKYII